MQWRVEKSRTAVEERRQFYPNKAVKIKKEMCTDQIVWCEKNQRVTHNKEGDVDNIKANRDKKWIHLSGSSSYVTLHLVKAVLTLSDTKIK